MFTTYFNKTYLLLFILLYNLPVQAEKITVVTEYLPPYQLENSDGSLGGFSTEIINMLFKLTGDQADITVLPWARAYNEAKYKKDTLIYSIAQTESRYPHFNWIGCMKTVRLFAWGLKTKFSSPINSIQALNSYTIAVTRNSSAGQYIHSLLPENQIYAVVHEDQAMKMLYRKRVDVIVGAEILFKHRAEKLKFDFSNMKKLLEIKPLNVKLCIAFNKDTKPAIIRRYKQAFKLLAASGELDNIKTKWSIK